MQHSSVVADEIKQLN